MKIKDGVLVKVHKIETLRGTFTIPKEVTQIGDNAFKNCKSLKTVIMHDGVTSIGYDAFFGCESLKEIIMSDGVTSIGTGAFDFCQSLEKIEIPKCKYIGLSAFNGCYSLKKLTLSEDLVYLGETAFSNCTNLDLNIETSLFSILFPFHYYSVSSNFGAHKVSIYDESYVHCFRDDYGLGYAKKDIQYRELKAKIDKILIENNIHDDKCFEYDEHRKFIQKIYANIRKSSTFGYNREPYDYRNDFNEYMNNYIKNYKSKLEPEIIGFEAENHITDNATSNSNANNQDHNVVNDTNSHVVQKDNNAVDNYANNNSINEKVPDENHSINLNDNKIPVINDINDLDGYANKLGLSSEIVAKLKNMINICLLKSNINDKKCFNDMSHMAFIREVLESMVQDRNYDYNTAVYHYMTNYIDTHKSKNESMSNSNNQIANESSDMDIINENNELRRKVEELEKELSNYRQSQENQSKVSLAKEPLVISDAKNELNSNARRR